MSDSRLISTCAPAARRLVTALSMLAATSTALAVETKVIRDDSFSQFSQGESTGTEILSDGFLKAAPEARRLDKTEEAVGWHVAVDRADGQIFYSTGHDGKVYRHIPGKSPELWAKLPEGQAISLAIDSTGGVVIGASPGGKIYRVVQAGKPQLLFDTKEQYVWDMIFDRDGVLYAATGPNGKIFRIRGASNGEIYYDSDATNVMALDFDSKGNLLAATQGRGMVLRVTGPNEGYVLYTSQDDEIRTLAADQDSGIIYAAVNGSRASSPLFESAPASEGQKAGPSSGGAEARPSPTPGRPSAEPSSPSYLVEIQPSGFVSNFWPSPEAPIHSVISDRSTSEGGVLVAAGKKGRLYRVTRHATHSILADVDEPMILSLASAPDGTTWFTTANKASLYRLDAPSRTGIFASRTLNAGSTVKWGNVELDTDQTSGAQIVVETRTGNTPVPSDKTWSPFTTATQVGGRTAKVESPVAQYLQYRLTIQAPPAGKSPVLDRVQVYYIQRNAPPLLRDVDVTKTGEGGGSASQLAALLASATRRPSPPSSSGRSSGGSEDEGSGSSGSRSSVLTLRAPGSSSSAARGDEGEGHSASSGAPENSHRFRATWTAADPNGDRLASTLSIKAEDENVWRLVEEGIPSNSYTLQTDGLADGQYRVKVEVSDSPENPDDTATTATLVSELFTVDNTAPQLSRLEAKPTGKAGEWEVTARAEDATSILSGAEYAVDNIEEFSDVRPEDGIFDFTTETFRFRVKPEKAGPEHVLTLRVYDREGNTQVGKVLLK